jgi:hypothetical protein
MSDFYQQQIKAEIEEMKELFGLYPEDREVYLFKEIKDTPNKRFG